MVRGENRTSESEAVILQYVLTELDSSHSQTQTTPILSLSILKMCFKVWKEPQNRTHWNPSPQQKEHDDTTITMLNKAQTRKILAWYEPLARG